MPHATLVRRIRAEYLEMPGLRLTFRQLQRLCGVDETLCKEILDVLVSERFLDLKPNGTYGRVTEGALPIPRPHPAKATLNHGKDLQVVTR